VVSNPYGYSPDMINANFIPSFEIDVWSDQEVPPVCV
jgi:hypothetical protein